MALVAQEKDCIGDPKPCQYYSTQVVPSTIVKDVLKNVAISTSSRRSILEVEPLVTRETLTDTMKHILIADVSSTDAKQ